MTTTRMAVRNQQRTPRGARASTVGLTLCIIAMLIAPLRPAYSQDPDSKPFCASSKEEVVRLWCQGGALFLQQTPAAYAKSIEPYSRALALEKKKRVLPRNQWLALVDNLGMAYGMGGDIDKARETFEYGLAQEPTYPMFHYNMACVYAEKGDEAKVLENLNKAFSLRANMIAGETMPDPATDDSFQRFMRSASFVAALKKLPGRSH